MRGVEEVRLDWASDHYIPILRMKSRKWEYVVLLHT